MVEGGCLCRHFHVTVCLVTLMLAVVCCSSYFRCYYSDVPVAGVLAAAHGWVFLLDWGHAAEDAGYYMPNPQQDPRWVGTHRSRCSHERERERESGRDRRSCSQMIAECISKYSLVFSGNTDDPAESADFGYPLVLGWWWWWWLGHSCATRRMRLRQDHAGLLPLQVRPHNLT